MKLDNILKILEELESEILILSILKTEEIKSLKEKAHACRKSIGSKEYNQNIDENIIYRSMSARINTVIRNLNRYLSRYSLKTIAFSNLFIQNLLIQTASIRLEDSKKYTSVGEKLTQRETSIRSDLNIFNLNTISLECGFISDAVARIIEKLDPQLLKYEEENLKLYTENQNYIIETSLKNFYLFGRVPSKYKYSVKDMIVNNRIPYISYIKKTTRSEYMIGKKQFINVPQIEGYLNSNSIMRASDLFITLEVNIFLYGLHKNKSFTYCLPEYFTNKLTTIEYLPVINRLIGLNHGIVIPECLSTSSDFIIPPRKLCEIKNILTFISYEYHSQSKTEISYKISLMRLLELNLIKKNKVKLKTLKFSEEKMLAHSYLYLNIFKYYYEWPFDGKITYLKSINNIYIILSKATFIRS